MVVSPVAQTVSTTEHPVSCIILLKQWSLVHIRVSLGKVFLKNVDVEASWDCVCKSTCIDPKLLQLVNRLKVLDLLSLCIFLLLSATQAAKMSQCITKLRRSGLDCARR